MRAILSISVIALMTALAFPASAQMCGGQASADGAGGMCGGGMSAAAAATPSPMMGEQSTPAAGEQAQANKGGCACCDKMAMMQMPMKNDAAPMDMPSGEAPQPTPPQ